VLYKYKSNDKQSLSLHDSLGDFSFFGLSESFCVVVTAVVSVVFSVELLLPVLTSPDFVSSPTAGGSTPPGITAPAVPSIPSPIGVNGFTGLPPQANGQPAAEAVFANGIHPYPGKTEQ